MEAALGELRLSSLTSQRWRHRSRRMAQSMERDSHGWFNGLSAIRPAAKRTSSLSKSGWPATRVLSASTRVVLLLILLVEGQRTPGRQCVRSAARQQNEACNRVRPLILRALGDAVGRRAECVSAAISPHATSQTLRRRRLGSRVNSGSNKKKARGSPGELAPATASSTALRCIYL